LFAEFEMEIKYSLKRLDLMRLSCIGLPITFGVLLCFCSVSILI